KDPQDYLPFLADLHLISKQGYKLPLSVEVTKRSKLEPLAVDAKVGEALMKASVDMYLGNGALALVQWETAFVQLQHLVSNSSSDLSEKYVLLRQIIARQVLTCMQKYSLY